LGGKTFVVSFDDTLATFARPVSTFELGRKHGRLALLALRDAREVDATAEVLLIPAVYHRRASEMASARIAYLQGIASIAPQIPVAWTGPHVFSKVIAAGDIAALTRATGLTFFVWDNAIANDWAPLLTGEMIGRRPLEKLSFGPIENLAPDVESAARGVVLNGAREPTLTKVALRTLADRRRGAAEYAPEASHANAIREIAGDEGAAILAAVYEWTCRHPFSSPARREAATLERMVEAYLEDADPLGDALKAELERLIEAASQAAQVAFTNAAVREALPTIRKASLIAAAAKLTLESRFARDPTVVAKRSRMISGLMRAAKEIRWKVGLDCLERVIESKHPPG
jgi:hypothetical protein